MAKIGKRQENLLAQIAKALGKDVEEIKEKAAPLYSHDELILAAQSVLNFYESRIRLIQGPKETDAQFKARYNEWRFRECKHCHNEFAYAYHYEGVAYCSLECLDAELKKVGMSVTRGRDLKLRWGRFHPAIVSSSALEVLRETYSDHEGVYDVPLESALPKSHQEADRTSP